VADGAPSLGHEGEGAFSLVAGSSRKTSWRAPAMSWVLPGSAAETRSGMPEGPVRAWTRAGAVVRLPRVPFVYFCALLASRWFSCRSSGRRR
jgi:hypothetical protein